MAGHVLFQLLHGLEEVTVAQADVEVFDFAVLVLVVTAEGRVVVVHRRTVDATVKGKMLAKESSKH